MGILRNALTTVLGCSHPRMSRVFTINDESYMVCPECGHRMYYSVVAMRPMTRREIRRMRRTHLTNAGPQRIAPAEAAKDPTLAA